MSDLKTRFLESLWKNYEEYVGKRHSTSIRTFMRSNRREFCFMPGVDLCTNPDTQHMRLNLQERNLLFAPEFFYALSNKYKCEFMVVLSCRDPEVAKLTERELHWSWASIELHFW